MFGEMAHLDVLMDEALAVHVGQGLDELRKPLAKQRLRHGATRVDKLKQIAYGKRVRRRRSDVAVKKGGRMRDS